MQNFCACKRAKAKLYFFGIGWFGSGQIQLPSLGEILRRTR
jgi:hypothetical protein